MNKFSTVILLLFVSVLAVSAGKKVFPKAEIKVSYTYPHLGLKTDGKAYETEYPMILLTNGQYSKFYSPRTEFNDSLHSTPSGRKVYHQLMTEGVRRYVETQDESFIPANHGALYVFKDSQDSTTTVYDSAGMSEFGVYSEPRGGMIWEIGDSVKTLLGYECVIATADFRGRSWTVWFTPEIPIDDGPWKLCGLPGLILEASENSGQHRFIADGIEICEKEIHPVYLPKKYSRMPRKEMLQAKRAYLLNGDVMTRQLIQNTPSGSRIEMEPIKADVEMDYHVDFLESDYHE